MSSKLLAAVRTFEAADDKDKDAEDDDKGKPFPGAAPPFKKKEAGDLVAAVRAFEAADDKDKDAEDDDKGKPFPGAAPPFKKKEAGDLLDATRAFEATQQKTAVAKTVGDTLKAELKRVGDTGGKVEMKVEIVVKSKNSRGDRHTTRANEKATIEEIAKDIYQMMKIR